MSKQLTKTDVLSLAKLARLTLTDNEQERFVDELNSILQYVQMLDSVNTDGLEPTRQVSGLSNVTRPDIVREQKASPESLLKGAPHSRNNYIQVKRMI